MRYVQNSSILTAYATLVTVALGLIGIDLHVRGNNLPDFPTQTHTTAASGAQAGSGAFAAAEQQTASTSTLSGSTL